MARYRVTRCTSCRRRCNKRKASAIGGPINYPNGPVFGRHGSRCSTGTFNKQQPMFSSSGDHCGCERKPTTCVSCRGWRWLAFRSSTNSCTCPGVALSERKASCFPSVDQAGSLSLHDLVPWLTVTRIALLPPARHINGLIPAGRSTNAPGNAQRASGLRAVREIDFTRACRWYSAAISPRSFSLLCTPARAACAEARLARRRSSSTTAKIKPKVRREGEVSACTLA